MATSKLSAIILAAGSNSRLAGVMPAYTKPLMLVNGKPLIRHAYDHAFVYWDVSPHDITVVAAPENVSLLTQVIPSSSNWVVQPSAEGVVDALRRGMPYVKESWTLILMADNTFSELSNETMVYTHSLIAVRDDLNPGDAARFTRVNTTSNPIKIYDRQEHLQDGDAVWIGPLVLPTDRIRKITEGVRPRIDAMSIESVIKQCTNNGETLQVIKMQCMDFGVPEAL